MPVMMFSGGLPDPDSVAGLQLWYDGEVGVYEDEAATDAAEDADEVRSWVDRKSSYKVWTVGGAGSGPAYDIDGANNLPCLVFDAGNDHLYTNTNDSDDYLSTSNTEFMVVKFADATPASIQYLISFDDGATKLDIRNIAAAQTIRAHNYDGSNDYADQAVGATLAQWRIYTRMNDGTNVYCGVDDTRTASMAATLSGNTSYGANTNLHIRNVPGGFVGVSIAEVVHYNVALTEANRQLVERYLAWKYGITLPY